MTRLSLVLLLVALPLSAQQLPNTPTISTTGSAEIKVVPDIIEIAAGVETVHTSLAKAKIDNDAAVAKVMAVAKERGIDPAKIQTDFIDISPSYSNESPRVPTYTVRKSIVIESNDLAGFEALLSAIINAGANHVHSVQFRTSDMRKHRDDARRMAIKAAQEKAKLIAEGFGRTVGKAYVIAEGHDGWSGSYGSWWGSRYASSANTFNIASSSGAATPVESTLAPGRISVTASVNVTFLLE